MASQASARQRAGRAGRTTSGVCYRFWTEAGHARRTEHWQPEIQRADLAPLLLELGLWGASTVEDLPWLERPPQASLLRAQELLTRLGLWSKGQLTTHGRAVAALAMHPRLGHMLLWAADHGVTEQACRLAINLEEQQAKVRSADIELMMSKDIPSSMQHRFSRLMKMLPTAKTSVDAPRPSVSVLLAQAYPDWIAQRRAGEPGRFLLACGAGAVLDSDEPLAHVSWIVAAELGGSGRQARIFKAMALDMDELVRFSPEHFASVAHLDWDERRHRVIAEQREMIGSLVLNTRPIKDISDSDMASALLVGIRRHGLDCLPWTEQCREWQARVQRMHQLSLPGKQIEWPRVDDEVLVERLELWLLPWLKGISSLKGLHRLELIKILQSQLDYQQQCLMDEWLPQRYSVPSGSSIRLSYLAKGSPVLSVRLQEMLGCAENPAVARGQIPLKVELLSPAMRPVQVTEDLANFWRNSYPAVKKEMAGRYPKHVWPDDPLSAQPTNRAKRRK